MKHVVFVLPQGCEVNLYCTGGAYEILSRADKYWQALGNRSKLSLEVASFAPSLTSPEDFLSARATPIRRIKKTDIVIIPPIYSDYDNAVQNNADLIDWIREQYKNGAELASMCSGAFLLAATGLLDGKSCSTHWDAEVSFKRMFPEVKIAAGKVVTDESGIYTNGGGYSYLNLMLYLVEKLFDRATAIFCSKIFQIDIERTTQSPFTIFHSQKAHGDELIAKAQAYIEENLEAKISFAKLATHFAISRRNFDRRFIKATGNTPVEYLQRVKVESAKKELEKGRKTVTEIMDEVGYNDDKAFREVFKKVTGLSPLDYKAKYRRDL